VNEETISTPTILEDSKSFRVESIVYTQYVAASRINTSGAGEQWGGSGDDKARGGAAEAVPGGV